MFPATANTARQLNCVMHNSPGCGAAPNNYYPTSFKGGITSIDDWDTSCAGIPMWEAGDANKNGGATLASSAYIDWHCATNTLCILVKTAEGFYLDRDAGQDWLKIYGLSQSVQVPTRLEPVYDANGIKIGWEGCYSPQLKAGCQSQVEIHANFNDNPSVDGRRTTSTGKSNGSGYIALDLSCTCSTNDDCKIDQRGGADGCYAASTCKTLYDCVAFDAELPKLTKRVIPLRLNFSCRRYRRKVQLPRDKHKLLLGRLRLLRYRALRWGRH